MTTPSDNGEVRAQLRALNNEYRETQVALNQAQASLSRAIKLAEQTYLQRRKQIISANGNGHDPQDSQPPRAQDIHGAPAPCTSQHPDD